MVWHFYGFYRQSTLPTSKSVILVVVDRLSKYGHFIPLSHPYTAQAVAKAFHENISKLHGQPESIVSDCDFIFIGNFWKELFHLLGVTLHMISSYHPRSDGHIKVMNRCLENCLRCFAGEQPLAKWWYNTTLHTAIQTTPFAVAFYPTFPVLHKCMQSMRK